MQNIGDVLSLAETQVDLKFANALLPHCWPFDEGIVISNTSFIETLVFSARAGIEMSPTVKDWLMKKRYTKVFFLASPASYESTAVRMESQQVALAISREVEEAYKHFGYQLVVVPAEMSLPDRCLFVEKHIGSNAEL